MIDVDKLSSLIKNNIPSFFKECDSQNKICFKLFNILDDASILESEILTSIYSLVFSSMDNIVFVDCMNIPKTLLHESKYIDECYQFLQSFIVTNTKFGMFFSENPGFSYSPVSHINLVSEIGFYKHKEVFINYSMGFSENKILSFDKILYDFKITKLEKTNQFYDIEYTIGFEFVNKKVIYILVDKTSSEYLDYISYKRDEKINKLLHEGNC